MSDSSGGGLSDLDDIDDLEMIMQQEEEAERVRQRNYTYQECLDAEERLMADYFGFSVIMKCTCDICQLAYDVTSDALDEYLQI
nr:hypothetical protein [Tanacetum cinerariifolium]